jgi:hypothetical protein
MSDNEKASENQKLERRQGDAIVVVRQDKQGAGEEFDDGIHR